MGYNRGTNKMRTNIKITDAKVLTTIKTHYYNESTEFFADCKRFCNALKEGRLISHAKSYGSANDAKYRIKLFEVAKDPYTKKYITLNFNRFFMAMGYKVNYHCEFLTSGGNIDIVYSSICYVLNRLHSLHILNDTEYRNLWGNKAHEI